MDPIIKTAFEAAAKGRSYAFATVISTTGAGTPRKAGAKMIVFADGSIQGTIGGGIDERDVIKECQKALISKKSKTITYELKGKRGQPICGGQFTVFIEPFPSPIHLIICGGGHIALPLTFYAKVLNYKVTLIDSRVNFANKRRFPHVDQLLCGPYGKMISRLDYDINSYFVIITPGHKYDFSCLKAALKTDSGYIGVIGSSKKKKEFQKKLKELQLTKYNLRRLKMPVGMDIGAQTPEEIAVSIVAEIIANLNESQLNSAKFANKKTF